MTSGARCDKKAWRDHKKTVLCNLSRYSQRMS